jgi:iron complex transport system substrate-binding protein
MKPKTLVLAGIVVCTILLTSPVLASAGYSMIYGNANEDDTLDMRDVTYIKLVIFGKKPETKLADANYDGKISMLDLGQTKLIILGKEKKLTLVDLADRTVTVPRPIERVVSLMPPITRYVIGLGAADKLVGVDSSSIKSVIKRYEDVTGLPSPKWDEVVGELKELPILGSTSGLNQEETLSLNPDVVIAYAGATSAPVYEKFQGDTGIPFVGFKVGADSDHMFEEIEFIGVVLGKEERAEEIVSSFREKLDEVTEVTSGIPDSEKPSVYQFWGSVFTKAAMRYDTIDLAGGINVAKDFAPPTFGSSVAEISKEQIILWNPDVILVSTHAGRHNPTVEDILSDPDLQSINAVKNERVYYTIGAYYMVGADPPKVIIETMLQAKLFHPENFEDLDLEEEGNEVYGIYYGVDGLWTEITENCDRYRWE